MNNDTQGRSGIRLTPFGHPRKDAGGAPAIDPPPPANTSGTEAPQAHVPEPNGDANGDNSTASLPTALQHDGPEAQDAAAGGVDLEKELSSDGPNPESSRPVEESLQVPAPKEAPRTSEVAEEGHDQPGAHASSIRERLRFEDRDFDSRAMRGMIDKALRGLSRTHIASPMALGDEAGPQALAHWEKSIEKVLEYCQVPGYDFPALHLLIDAWSETRQVELWLEHGLTGMNDILCLVFVRGLHARAHQVNTWPASLKKAPEEVPERVLELVDAMVEAHNAMTNAFTVQLSDPVQRELREGRLVRKGYVTNDWLNLVTPLGQDEISAAEVARGSTLFKESVAGLQGALRTFFGVGEHDTDAPDTPSTIVEGTTVSRRQQGGQAPTGSAPSK